ncbi:MAG: aminotransferase class V-fold PLP-dependent enzyme [Actinomycetota bacterium]|nr:aminotransferase class V-fold PLP-dependent enzyme [Actinomycetota bacterium]
MSGVTATGYGSAEHARPLAIEDAQALWSPAAPYLNTASFGLPPRPAWDALQEALADWRHGRTSWEGWCATIDEARTSFARLVGVAPDDVAVGGSVSELLGLVAASLPNGARVVAPEIDFTSLLYPFLAHADRGVETRTVPIARLAECIDSRTTVVAVSVVQSATGEVVDLDAVVAAAREHDALVVLDATHACGWLPIDAARADFVAAAAYKWLMSPRGTAFLTVGPNHRERLRPLAANWWAGEDPYGTYYGPPLLLAREARRFDFSPAWFSWVGTAPALDLVERIGVEAIHAHDLALANRFRAGLGLPPDDSAIVRVSVPDAEERFRRAGIRAAVRAGTLRASFHVYNTESDVDAALSALA